MAFASEKMHSDAAFEEEAFKAFASEKMHEEAFKAEAFRLVFPVHVLIFASLVSLLTVGLFDGSFNAISQVLLPPAIVEGLLRIWLHHGARFRADHPLAQRIGAQVMLLLTSGSWAAYYFIARQMREQPAAGPLISALVPMMMVIYPTMMTLFFLSPTQRTVATAVSFATILASPRWSSLRDRPALEGEAAVHMLALALGLFIAQPMESTLRSFAINFLEVGQEHGASRHGASRQGEVRPDQLAAVTATPAASGGSAPAPQVPPEGDMSTLEAEISMLAAAAKARAEAKPKTAAVLPSSSWHAVPAPPPTTPSSEHEASTPCETIRGHSLAVAPTTSSSSMPSVFESLTLASEYEQHWEQVRVLGAGHFGKAILLRHRERDELAVVKEAWAGHAQAQDVTRLEREVSALMSLTNRRHIVGYRTCFLQGEMLCIVTDYAAGGTLDQQIRHARKASKREGAAGGAQASPPFAAEQLLRWTSQLASALFCIHSEGIMHRDVKPSNILLTSALDILLGDFGLSRRTPDEGAAHGAAAGADVGDLARDDEADEAGDPLAMTTCGTPYYMSPEQMCSEV